MFTFSGLHLTRERIKRFSATNFDLNLDWILRDQWIRKDDCYSLLQDAGVKLPEMYRLGFRNNNCIGCVKATSAAYWSLVRKVDPVTFKRRCLQSRDLGVRLVRWKGERIYLDELPDGDFFLDRVMEEISCGPECSVPE